MLPFIHAKLTQLSLALLILFAAPMLLSPATETRSQEPPACSAPLVQPPAKLQTLRPYEWVRQTPLISHALGGIDGHAGTNSREGLIHAYNCGHRVFETDISVTADGELVLRHDWEAGTYPVLGQPVPSNAGPMPLATFRAFPIQGHYSPMTFKELLAFMSDHPDMLLVTDTKEPDDAKAAAIFKRLVAETEAVDPSLLNRLIPQLYQAGNYEAVTSVYPFDQFIYTLYMNEDSDEQVIRDVSRRGIRIVVMNEKRYSPEFVHALKEKGVYAYVHTINDVSRIRKLREQGAQGVMTDFAVPEELDEAL
ncbi:phosphatidylinositol-specific phospholipase C/glycerophosphodiester phosphodiesterase family protein [Paenibacillus glycinis]|uniref:GP-PDE domain-containing protein n=1 Tax=Paenibacillus glycinis TaxID=2697035 RepID=A0ABW9XW65_9BACL|nr:phosphatidylinositol-specific phospholipase C/glycerophosphodiester phosphodiesterase family protein [Paenibacillus glycinis]NBD26925.1 hypothetical protein [Paenibacillus glycinis]